MITTKQIMEAVSDLAAEQVTALRVVYTDLVPKNFKRPCLLVQPVTRTAKPAGRLLFRVTEHFKLTVFDETDEYSHSNTGKLLDLQQGVLDLFLEGHIQVDDRALSVTASTGGRDWDLAFVDITFEYFDEREKQQDTTPLMQSLETKFLSKG